MGGTHDYDAAAAASRRPAASRGRDDMELIRLATLAASSHNTQPWTFESTPTSVVVRPDPARRCKVVDPDDAHLYKSIGCAVENLMVAAAAQGLRAEASFDPSADAVTVALTEGMIGSADGPDAHTDRIDDFAAAMLTRQCTRGLYDGSPIDPADLSLLERAGRQDDARCVLLTKPEHLDLVVDSVERGNLVQLADPAFRDELFEWIRFNPRSALATRDGLAGRANGQPALPTAVARLLRRFIVSARGQARLDTARLRSSAGVAAFVAPGDDKATWVSVGRAYQGFALQAELLDIRTAFVNQPVEVPALRAELEDRLGLVGERVHLLVRFGHGERLPYSLRRDPEEVTGARRGIGGRSS